ncbi:hypothetical protein OIU74_024139 [Salix koriyanagi]|uniref:Uncharacterized protein n=1 Tax=Salix koriyanagi TaxID=2511006 RepID=A0A9Q0W671_9ROSI|nr:hypothetical protein OIU74_024139 [Salix koriyanagi]
MWKFNDKECLHSLTSCRKQNQNQSVTVPIVTASIVPGAGPFRSSAYVVRFYLPVKFQAVPPVPLDVWNSYCVAVRKFSVYAKDGNTAIEGKRLSDSLSRSPWPT